MLDEFCQIGYSVAMHPLIGCIFKVDDGLGGLLRNRTEENLIGESGF